MQLYEIWVYLKERPFPGLVPNKHLIATEARVVDGILWVETTEADHPDYAFNMQNVIYWTSKPFNREEYIAEDDQD
jgi:hypothetical protein